MTSNKIVSFSILSLMTISFGVGMWYQNHKTKLPGDQVQAAVGTLSISTTSNANNLVGAQFLDQADNTYLLDPASTGNSLLVAGSVGIGNTSPTEKLEITGNLMLTHNAGSSRTISIKTPTVTSALGTDLYITAGANEGSSANAGGDLYINGGSGTAYGDVILANSGGKVGIATTSPASALDVTGTINATTFGTAVAKVTNQCTHPCTITATCAAGKNVIYGMSAAAVKTCDSNPSTCTAYCTPGSSSCAATSTATGASVVIYCGKIN